MSLALEAVAAPIEALAPTQEAERLVAHVACLSSSARVTLLSLSTSERLRVIADSEPVTMPARREQVRGIARAALQSDHVGHWTEASCGALHFLANPAPGVMLVLVVELNGNGDADLRLRLASSAGWISDFIALWWRNERSQARCAGLRAAFGTLESGAILLDGHGNVIEVNRAARAVLKRRDALLLNGSKLGAVDPEDAALLRRTIMKFAVASRIDPHLRPHHLLIRRGEGLRPVSVAVLCPGELAATARLDSDPAVLMLLADAETTSDSVATACQVYGLSKSETVLAHHLVAGLSIEEIAAAMALKPDSVRTYLKHIFEKTGVSRQSTLVRLLLNSRLPVDELQPMTLLNRYRRPPRERRRQALATH